MKKLVQFLAVVLTSLLFIKGAFAVNLKSTRNVVKITTEKVTAFTDAAGMETFSGSVIKISKIKKRWLRKKTMKEILGRGQIELTNGEIIYPEEVQFALLLKEKGSKFGSLGKAPQEKAPHTDEE